MNTVGLQLYWEKYHHRSFSEISKFSQSIIFRNIIICPEEAKIHEILHEN